LTPVFVLVLVLVLVHKHWCHGIQKWMALNKITRIKHYHENPKSFSAGFQIISGYLEYLMICFPNSSQDFRVELFDVNFHPINCYVRYILIYYIVHWEAKYWNGWYHWRILW
jgi:hypothetical protein